MNPVPRVVAIDAPAGFVFDLLTTAEGLLRWMAVEAVAEARPGGLLRWRHENGATMVGRFVELLPPHRVVFTYGWEDGRMGVPRESSRVEIDLVEAEGKTFLRLQHHGLPFESVDAHRIGWTYFLDRLVVALTG